MGDPEGHILFFDVEALIVQLLTEEYTVMSPGGDRLFVLFFSILSSGVLEMFDSVTWRRSSSTPHRGVLCYR